MTRFGVGRVDRGAPGLVASSRCMRAVIAWLCVGGAIACSSTDGSTGANDDAGPDATSMEAASADGEGSDGGTVDAGHPPSPDAAVDASLDASLAPGPPSLLGLSVSAAGGDGSAAVTLVPAFSADIHDYAVRCAEGPNDLTVSMTASPGSSSLVVQPTLSPSLPQQTVQVTVMENGAIVAAATDGAATVEYWIRCLPADFPLLQWTPHPDAGAVTPGYYLVGTALPTTSGCYAIVLDSHGVPVWYTQSEPDLGWCVFDVDAVVGGAISFDAIIDAPPAFEVHGLAPYASTRIAPAGMLNVDLHELRVLDNGDYLVLSTPLQPGVDVTGLRVSLPDGGIETLSGIQSIQACNLVEFQPDGGVVWTWKATDHFDAVADSVYPTLTPYGPVNSLVVDPFHCNSIDVDPTSGNLLVSAREMASLFYIEKSSGRVVWKMGGAPASKDGATYVAVPDAFALQHDARFQPDWVATCNGGSGHISLFDDEVPGGPSPARAVVYDVVVGAGDGGAGADGGCGGVAADAGTATVSWQRPGSGPSMAMGSFRILPDGSRVIGWGLIPGEGFTEVDVDGNDLADLTFPDGNTTYRAIKVPLDAFDPGSLRSTAGLP
jgi:hypothetical protein